MSTGTTNPDAAATANRSGTHAGADRLIGKPRAQGNGGNGPLERVTVNMTGRASRALDLVTKLTGDTKTDTVNRALQIYAYLEQITASGGSIYVKEAAGAALELLKVF